MKRILVCEDEASIREFVVFNLQRAGFLVEQAASGEQALEIFAARKEPFDVALLDLMLPQMDGFSVCRALRKQDAFLGIIMLTARSQEAEKVEGLQCGADDYVTKPFGMAELQARIESLCRRVQILRERDRVYADKLHRGDFTLDITNRTLQMQDKTVALTPIELQVLEFFFMHPDRCHTRTEILRCVWGDAYAGDDKVVDVNLRRLRMKIEQDPSNPRHLITVWKKGYKWED